MREVSIQQLLFLAFIIMLPLIEQVLKRRQRSQQQAPREIEQEPEPEFEIEDFRDAEGPEREPVLSQPEREPVFSEPKPIPVPVPPRVPPREPVVVRQPSKPPLVVVRKAPVYATRAASPVYIPGGPPPKVWRSVPRINAREARRGVVLMEILGPCVAMREASQR